MCQLILSVYITLRQMILHERHIASTCHQMIIYPCDTFLDPHVRFLKLHAEKSRQHINLSDMCIELLSHMHARYNIQCK